MKTKIKKSIIIKALQNEYGFRPLPNEIEIVRSDVDGFSMEFLVNGVRYNFESHKTREDGVVRPWTGRGTINKAYVKPCEYAYGEKV